jgi:hypothetical protein
VGLLFRIASQERRIKVKKAILGFLGIALFVFMAGGLVSEARGQEVIWKVPTDFPTIQAAIDSTFVMAGHTILVEPGSHAGAFIYKPVEIRGEGNALINSGPVHTSSGLIQGFRFLAGSDGASLNHLIFEVDLAIMNGDAVNDVTIDHCTFNNTIQAISNWRGNGWVITHNDIIDLRTRCGGGIGILIGDYTGGVVKDNLVSHNKISGTLHVAPADCGGYNGTGIVLYADFRWGRTGAYEIKNNRVVKNNVSLISNGPSLVDVGALELTDTRDDVSIVPPMILDNAVTFNDFRGTVIQISLTPYNLDLYNDISRNLGDNRGLRLNSKAFLHE